MSNNKDPKNLTRARKATEAEARAKQTAVIMNSEVGSAILSEMKIQRTELIERLDGIDGHLASISTTISTMQRSLKDLNKSVAAHESRITEAEQRISRIEDTINSNERALNATEKTTAQLEAQIDDLINRSKRNNVILRGLPEQPSEKQTLIPYLQEKLPIWLGLPATLENAPDPLYEMERAHRSFGAPPKPGRPPRPVIIRFLRSMGKEQVLRATRKGPIKEGGATLTFHQDLSAEVRRKRREFDTVIKSLIEKNMFRGFQYPHKLRIVYQGNLRFFDSPKAVTDFLRENCE